MSAVLWAFGVPDDAYRLGKTRVFFRAGQLALLQSILQVGGAGCFIPDLHPGICCVQSFLLSPAWSWTAEPCA